MTAYESIRQDLRASPRRWLITGVAGFIGSHLLEQLLQLRQSVVGLDNFSTGHQRNLEEVRRNVSEESWAGFRMIEGDITNPKDCASACEGIDLVLHQAALGSVPRSIGDPQRSYAVNVMGFLNMIVAARDAGVKRIVYASSSSVYGDHPDLPKREEKIGEPLSPYAATKYINELTANVFARCYGCETVGLRYFNVFGPRQDPNGPYAAVIPKWIAALLAAEKITINGDGETSRDFCYVDNVVQANILAAGAGAVGAVNQVYNVALNTRISLIQVFETIQRLLAERRPSLSIATPCYGAFRSGDVRHSQACVDKGVERLGYAPSVSFEDGLRETVDWHTRETNVRLGSK